MRAEDQARVAPKCGSADDEVRSGFSLLIRFSRLLQMIQGETDEEPAQLIYCCTLYSGLAHQFTICLNQLAQMAAANSAKENFLSWITMNGDQKIWRPCRDENINKTAPGDLILGSYYQSHHSHHSYHTHRCYRYINLPADRFAGTGLHPRLDITGVSYMGLLSLLPGTLYVTRYMISLM